MSASSYFHLPVKLLLSVHYPDAYPDVLPELKLTAVEGEATDNEIEALTRDLLAIVSVPENV